MIFNIICRQAGAERLGGGWRQLAEAGRADDGARGQDAAGVQEDDDGDAGGDDGRRERVAQQERLTRVNGRNEHD